MYYLHKATSAVSCVKPNASQWEATLRDDVGFPTVYRRIYRRKFLTLSNQTSRYIRKCIRMFVHNIFFCRCFGKAVSSSMAFPWVHLLYFRGGSRIISEGWGRFDQTTVLTLCIRKDSPEQTVYTQIRRCWTRRLIRVYTVCHPSNNFKHINK